VLIMSELYYAASGIITPVGGRAPQDHLQCETIPDAVEYNFDLLMISTLCSSSGGQSCITKHLVSSHSVGGRPVHSPVPTCTPDGHLHSVTIPDVV